MGKNRQRSRQRKRHLVGIGALVAITLAIVAFTLSYHPTPPPPTIDIAAVESKRAEDIRATAEAEAAAVEAGKVDIAFPEGRPLRVLLAGDSLSEGLYATTEADAFRSLLLGRLDDLGEVQWSGIHIPGAKVADIAAKPSPQVENDLAIVELGTNDAFRAVPVSDFATQYGEYLDRLSAESPGVHFLCLGGWNEQNAKYAPYDEAIKAVCEERGGKFAPLAPIRALAINAGPVGVDTWKGVSDGGHPNDRGHQQIAALIVDRLSRLAG